MEFTKKCIAHIKLSKSEINVNSFVDYCDKSAKAISRNLLAELIRQAQNHILNLFLGKRWTPSSGKATPWECPRCAARTGFKRRGKRYRKLKTSIGIVRFSLLQVTCEDCNKTFSPFPDLLGIKSCHRLSRELECKIADLVKDFSYAKTATLTNKLFDLNLSPHTIHKMIQHYGAEAEIIEDFTHISHLQTDSTKINASINERGIDVHLALSIGASEKKNGRTFRHKKLVSVQVSDQQPDIKKVLKKSRVDQITVDGKSGLEKYIENNKIPVVIQRCLWHIPRTTAHMMYCDGVKIAFGRELAEPLKYFLFDEKCSVSSRLKQYDDFIEKCNKLHLRKTTVFLKRARKKLYSYKQFDDSDVHGRTTSIVERQMREINRRMENGSRWSKTGAQNLLKLKMIQELNPESYKKLWKLTKIKKNNYKVILC